MLIFSDEGWKFGDGAAIGLYGGDIAVFRKDDQASAWSKHGWCLRAERDFLAPSQRDKPVMFSPKLVLSGLYFGYTSAVKAWLTVSLDMFGVSLV